MNPDPDCDSGATTEIEIETEIDSDFEIDCAFEYENQDRAALIERSIRQEIGEIESDRTRTTMDRDGYTITIRIEATDFVALRAGLNTWCTFVEVAERCSVA